MKTTNNLWNLVQFSNLTIKTPEQRHSQRSGVSIVNFEQTSHTVLVFPLLTLTVNVGWVKVLTVT